MATARLDEENQDYIVLLGDVGSGKSSLLSAIVGDMLYVSEEQMGQKDRELTSD